MQSSSTSSSSELAPAAVAAPRSARRALLLWVRDATVALFVAFFAFEALIRVLGLLGVSLPSQYPIKRGPGETFVFTGQYFTFPDFVNPVALNNLGFHDMDRAVPVPPGVTRVAVWGDSLIEGYQVPTADLFTTRLELALTTPAHPVEVMNLGYSGARVRALSNPVVKDHLKNLGVTSLLVEIHSGMEMQFEAAAHPNALLPPGFLGFPESRFAALRRRLLEDLGWNGLFLLRNKLEMAWAQRSPGAAAADFYSAADAAALEPTYEHVRETLVAVKALSDELGIRVALLYAPAWAEVVAAVAADSAGGRAHPGRDTGAILERVEAMAAEIGLPIIDITPAFVGVTGKTHFDSDRHWTALGHDLVAKRLLSFVRDELVGSPGGGAVSQGAP